MSPLSLIYAPAEYAPLIPEEEMRTHLGHVEKCEAVLRLATDGYPAARGMDHASLYRSAARFPRIVSEDIRFGSGGMYCHELYFRFLAPPDKAAPPCGMAEAIMRESYDSAEGFCYRFRVTAAETRLNGFLFVTVKQKNGRWQMKLSVTEGYRLPERQWGIPVFALDLWEHAYMSVWREDRAAYAQAYLRQLDFRAVNAFLGDVAEGKHRS